jgi:hypothetical protein
MKKLFIIVLFFLLVNYSAFTQSILFDTTLLLNPLNGSAFKFIENPTLIPIKPKSYLINQLDTVIFDLYSGTYNTDYIEFPVSINSDDPILSLDFSFQFNNTNYIFDTIYPLINPLQYLSFFNPSDLRLRFTSNSLNQYPLTNSIINIGFQIIDISFCELNITNPYAYLNGEPCAIKITDCPFPTSNIETLDGTISIFPNPVSDELFIEQPANSIIQLFNTTGKLMFETFNSQRKTQLPLNDLQNGIYFLYLKNINSLSVHKIQVLH